MTEKYYSSVTYEDLIEAINSPYHYDDHEKLIYIVHQIGRHFSVNVDNWVKVLDTEQQLYLQDQTYYKKYFTLIDDVDIPAAIESILSLALSDKKLDQSNYKLVYGYALEVLKDMKTDRKTEEDIAENYGYWLK